MSEERFVDIEVRLEYQDRTIETLDTVVLELRRELTELRAELALLRQRIETQDDSVGPHAERPPHY